MATSRSGEATPAEEPELPETDERAGTEETGPAGPGERGGRTIPDIVARAASVLEEELATGIVAAQKVEQRFVDVDQLRSKDPDELVQRVRRDIHDLVDILVDLLDIAAGSASSLARRVVSVQTDRPSRAARPVGVSLLEIPEPVAAGESARVSMLVDNESTAQTQAFELVTSDLISAERSVIAASQISLDPAAVQLGPNERRRITIDVAVPPETPPGTYVGVVQATVLEHVRAVLAVRVA